MKNIHPIFERIISRDQREHRLNQKSCVFWLTGLSGSGKSTLGIALERKLFEQGFFPQILDGDNVRTGINNNLGFTEEERVENIRRIAEVAKLYVQSGVIVISSFISPTVKIRNMARKIIGEDDFIEIFIDTPLEVCEERDVKGLYAKAREGKILNFTGIDAPYEAPNKPDFQLKTVGKSVDECMVELYTFALEKIDPKHEQ